MKVSTIETTRFGIGEGAIWDEADQRFYAVDVMAGQIVCYDPIADQAERFNVGGIVGSVALRAGGGAVVGLENGVHLFDFGQGDMQLIADVEPDDESLLLTEGKVDPAGRYIVSSFALEMKNPVGSFFAVEPDLTVRKLRSDIVVPNGLAWSPDGGTIYFADSHLNTVYSADYDLANGTLSNERLFANTTDLGGIPDGATTDMSGNYWVAICQAGIVAGYDSSGTLIEKIEFPSKWVSSVAFGGANLDRLFVTSLNPGMMNIGDDPEGGKLFVVDGLRHRGIASQRCKI